MHRFQRALRVLSLGLVAGCHTVTIEEVAEHLLASDIRCLVSEEDLTVLSPYPPLETAKYLSSARSNLDALEAALDVELQRPVLVQLVPEAAGTMGVTFDGDRVAVHGRYARPSRNGILGTAMSSDGEDAPTVTLIVAPLILGRHADGRRIEGYIHEPFDEVMRHELAHLCAFRAGLRGPVWFSEGLAQTFEHCALDKLELTPPALPEILVLAARLHRDWTVADLLDWKEDAAAVDAGLETGWGPGRPLAYAWMRFLLEGDARASWRERFERIRTMTRAELLAFERPWHAWLDGIEAAAQSLESRGAARFPRTRAFDADPRVAASPMNFRVGALD